jgi:Tol biopolymer transport system component
MTKMTLLSLLTIAAIIGLVLGSIVVLSVGLKVKAASLSRIVFTERDRKSLVVANADGSDPQVILRSATFYLSPQWSSDGQYISFFQRGANDAGIQLYRITLEGKDVYPMQYFDEHVTHYEWSADSQSIIVYTYFRTTTLDLEGKVTHTRYILGDDMANGTLSPDRKLIAYTKAYEPRADSATNGRQLWIADADGGNTRMVAEHLVEQKDIYLREVTLENIQWSPDSKALAYLLDAQTATEDKFNAGRMTFIYLINADGTGERRLTTNEAPEIGFAWSPDSTKIAFRAFRDKQDNQYVSGVYMINVDGSDDHMVAIGEARDTNGWKISWSPDGRYLAYDAYPPLAVYLIDANGSNKRVLKSNELEVGDAADASWEPLHD